MNTNFKPLENKPVVIEKVEDALRQGKLEECRRLAAPIVYHYSFEDFSGLIVKI